MKEAAPARAGDAGVSSVEYALLAVFVPIAIFGGAVGGLFDAGSETFPESD